MTDAVTVQSSIFCRRRIADAAWDYWWEIGRRRSVHHAGRLTSEYTHPNSHELGAIGEYFFGWIVGQRAADDLNELAGDDGCDFLNVDVKAVEIIDRPWLKVRKEKNDSAPDGFAFALVAVDIRSHVARYCGYATKEMLAKLTPQQIALRVDRSTAHTGLKRSAAYGPLSYIVKDERSLVRALPPGFSVSESFLREPNG